MHSDWRLGEVIEAVAGKDGLVRNIRVKNSVKPGMDESESDLVKTWRTNAVTTPVCECVKLFNVEETFLVTDIRKL